MIDWRRSRLVVVVAWRDRYRLVLLEGPTPHSSGRMKLCTLLHTISYSMDFRVPGEISSG